MQHQIWSAGTLGILKVMSSKVGATDNFSGKGTVVDSLPLKIIWQWCLTKFD